MLQCTMYNANESLFLQMTGVKMHAQCLMQSGFVSQTIGHHMQASHDVEVSKVGAGVDDGVGNPDDVQPGPDVQSLCGGPKTISYYMQASHVEVSKGGAGVDGDQESDGSGNLDDDEVGSLCSQQIPRMISEDQNTISGGGSSI